MLRQLLIKFGDNTNRNSWAVKLRKKRFLIFTRLIGNYLNDEITILDVGGTEMYWEYMDFIKPNIHITLLNLEKEPTKYNNFISIIGDACNMSDFNDKSFEIIHSNSVLEHVGSFNDQMKMAAEVKRVGRSYFLQTPNYYFPIEPHFYIIGFQFMPVKMRAFIHSHWIKKTHEYKKSIPAVKSIRLLKKKELKQLFPNASIYREKIFGFTKSFIVYENFKTNKNGDS